MPPRASVLMPVGNARPYLDEALDSVLTERDVDLELIAIDDGSEDGSGDTLDRRARADPRVRVLRQPRSGIVAALNRALAEARAEVVIRMDADDRSLPGRLSAQIDHLEAHPELDVCGTGVELHPAGRRDGGMRRYVSWLNSLRGERDIERSIWIESPLAHPTIAARRSALRAVDGYRDGPFPEDYDLLLRLHLAGCRLGRVDVIHYQWRDHGQRLTRTDPRYEAAAFRALKVAHLRAGPLSGIDAVAIWGAGQTGKPMARALLDLGIRIDAWVEVDPRKIGRELFGAPILSIDDLERVRGTLIIVAVGAAGARELIRTELAERAFEELREYIVVA